MPETPATSVPSVTTKKAPLTARPANELVYVDGTAVGTVWREQVSVVVSKLTEPRRMALKDRWFAKQTGASETLGRGTRVAMLLGPGFKTKKEAVAELVKACCPKAP